MSRWGMCAVVAAAAVLTACGGGDGHGNSDIKPMPPVAFGTAEGFWIGKMLGADVTMAILESGETWGIYTRDGILDRVFKATLNPLMASSLVRA